jgi:hypothetical protein
MSVAFVPAYPSRPRTRTINVQEAVTLQLTQMRDMLDAARDVRAITISVKMKNGTPIVRAVVVQVDTETVIE